MVTIADDDIRGLGTILATAMPVIAVAFYTVRNAPDELDGVSPELHGVVVRGWYARCLARWPLRPLIKFFGSAAIEPLRSTTAQSKDSMKGPRFMRIHQSWRVGTDRGFILRATFGFSFALAPFLFGPDSRIARILLSVSIPLVVFSLSALIQYSTLISSLRLTQLLIDAASKATGRFQDNDAGAHESRLASALSHTDPVFKRRSNPVYAGDSILIVNGLGIITTLLALAAAVWVACSSPPSDAQSTRECICANSSLTILVQAPRSPADWERGGNLA